MPTERLIAQCYLKLSGDDAPTELLADLLDVTVEEELQLPAMFVIRLHDPTLRWMDGETLALGTEVEVAVAGQDGRRRTIACGEVTALEPEFTVQGPTLTVRGYDRLHRLSRGRRTRVFASMTDADIAAQIARDAGLRAETDASGPAHGHVLQHNQTDWEFLLERARQIGFVVRVDGRTLQFRRQPPESSPLELEWGEGLSGLRLRQSAGGQVAEVVVRGWDPKAKREITGVASAPRGLPQIGEERDGGAVVRQAFGGSPQQVVVHHQVGSQGEADALAQAILDELGGAHVTAEGVAAGNPALRAGARVQLANAGRRFGGVYTLTAVTHRYSSGGYSTTFRASGRRQLTLAALLAPPPSHETPGVVVGVVTSVEDPEGRGRVRLRYPWLDGGEGSVQSDWARLAAPGAGAERGVCFVPEVGDEVLVAFAHGDMRAPYVVGGLWNGQDRLPEPAVSDGKIARRTIRSRAGHQILIVDEDGGQGMLQIETAGGRRLTLSDTDRGVEIKTDSHTVRLDDGGRSLALDTQGDLTLKASGKVQIEGQQGLELKSSVGIEAQATQVKLQANGTLDVKANAVLTIQGSLVRIN